MPGDVENKPNTQIDFYVLKAEDTDEANRFVCRLVDQVLQQDHRTRIQVLADTQRCGQLDELLWNFRSDRFIPHRISPETGAPKSDQIVPVILGSQAKPVGQRDVLVNLLDEGIPDSFPVPRIVELVLNDPASKAASRERYRFYQARGIRPGTIQIDARF